MLHWSCLLDSVCLLAQSHSTPKQFSFSSAALFLLLLLFLLEPVVCSKETEPRRHHCHCCFLLLGSSPLVHQQPISSITSSSKGSKKLDLGCCHHSAGKSHSEEPKRQLLLLPSKSLSLLFTIQTTDSLEEFKVPTTGSSPSSSCSAQLARGPASVLIPISTIGSKWIEALDPSVDPPFVSDRKGFVPFDPAALCAQVAVVHCIRRMQIEV